VIFTSDDLIGAALPGTASAEAFADAPEPAMHQDEAALVSGAAPERRREFATVRCCARAALAKLGVPAAPILPGTDRAPRWPAGVVGSMTHCAGYRAAAVARSAERRALGIDAEPHAALPGEALDLVARDEERERLLALGDAAPGLHWDRILFSVKEAVFKAWFPLTRRWLDFADVAATLDPDGTFSANRRTPGPGPERFAGRWLVARGLIVTATAVERTGP
jgi:4'-phosphopantetheinyl transferase EntD